MNAKKPRYFHLTPSRKKLAKYIGRGNKVSIVKQFLREPQYKELIIVQIGLLIQRELRALASRKGNSLLRNKSKEAFLSFSWDVAGIGSEDTNSTNCSGDCSKLQDYEPLKNTTNSLHHHSHIGEVY